MNESLNIAKPRNRPRVLGFKDSHFDNKHKRKLVMSNDTDTDATGLSPEKVRDILKNCYDDKPEDLWMKRSTWRGLVWAATRGENVLLTGPTGFGKTWAAMKLADAYGRPFFKFPLGQSQDPELTFIGTREAKDGTTEFSESKFVEAIQTPNAIVLLDELSRATPDGWNILMAPLDPDKRYLRIDATRDARQVDVHPTVTFVATANVGINYTAARTMDLALLGRFEEIEVDIPDKTEEYELLAKQLFGDAVNNGYIEPGEIEALTKIAEDTREACWGDGAATELNKAVATRDLVQCCKMLRDGLGIWEVVRTRIFTIFPDEGGSSNPRAYVENLAEGYLPAEEETFRTDDDGSLFDEDMLDELSG